MVSHHGFKILNVLSLVMLDFLNWDSNIKISPDLVIPLGWLADVTRKPLCVCFDSSEILIPIQKNSEHVEKIF